MNFFSDCHTRAQGVARFSGCNINATSNQFTTMLSWAITFLVIALIAAVLGFGGLAGTAVGIAKILFFVFIVLFVISLILGRRTPPVA